VETAVKKLPFVIANKLVVWDIEEQRNIHVFLSSKDYKLFQKVKPLLPKKSLKEILDYISK
jgi:hypothetical protein